MQIVIGYGSALLCALVVIFGDTLIKLTADQGQPLHAPAGLAGLSLYVLSGIFWFLAVQQISLGQAGVAFAMFSLLALCVIGAVVFDEPVAWREVAGIGCALAALLLMVRVA
ncbi:MULTISPECIES: hypothetical protein [unclassified Meridianimarinicoccus]|uniref:hypothetical protein n=1 Tax=unclassified Meridianimarinicoccus TaxID=2923344 RepID=UPI001868881D|nr:hypothetical protein [Fluviibacterium sp. MJW13]